MFWWERQHQSWGKYMTCLFKITNLHQCTSRSCPPSLSFLPLCPVFPLYFLFLYRFLQYNIFFSYLNYCIISLQLRHVVLPFFHPSFSCFSSPPLEYQHFIIQQGFTGALWNHLFHGSLIECDTSHTSNGRCSDCFSLCLSESSWRSCLYVL